MFTMLILTVLTQLKLADIIWTWSPQLSHLILKKWVHNYVNLYSICDWINVHLICSDFSNGSPWERIICIQLCHVGPRRHRYTRWLRVKTITGTRNDGKMSDCTPCTLTCILLLDLTLSYVYQTGMKFLWGLLVPPHGVAVLHSNLLPFSQAFCHVVVHVAVRK